MVTIDPISLNRGPSSRCPECGARISGGLAGCEAMYHEVVKREFAESTYFVVHNLTESAYTLQHPHEHMYTPRLFAAGLCKFTWLMEYRADAIIGESLKQWLSFERPYELITPPSFRGGLTIVEVYNAPNAPNHVKRVKRWAAEVWDAYAAYQGLGITWIEQSRKLNLPG
ncbi:hypothetical protein HGA91_05950 [candidate division WWE3 bacterium]|nr:hypothetical protein [candidate division WWE3 bacterium]